MKVFDLSPRIHPGLGVFPGDVAFERKISLDFKKGHHLLLSSIQTTLHLGAHADSTSHYHASGEGIDKKSLTPFFGKAQVLHVPTRRGKRVTFDDVKEKKILAPRILLCTNSFPDPDHWNSDFMGLEPELIDFLAAQSCLLVGLDTPSVDLEGSKKLEAHQALQRSGMSVLEGLLLSQVPEGVYTLMALPLPFVDADASPVRALLFEDPSLFSENQIFEFK